MLWLLAVVVGGVAALILIHNRSQQSEAPVITSNRPALIREAQAALRADPSIADLVYSTPRDQWDVTPAAADTDPKAFAHYLCFTLAQAGVTQPHTSVRVIDGARLEANGFDYAAASRGTIDCGAEKP
ncbi:hypothetical protein EAH87_02100 [Sphingomonas koreensis]|nr:hypothetical protein EAH87_02100 [Sphingomonas koreensis]